MSATVYPESRGHSYRHRKHVGTEKIDLGPAPYNSGIVGAPHKGSMERSSFKEMENKRNEDT
ncbi:hypothetical protein ACIGG5_32505 [Streptomyces sp. NPDC085463]|uniref:hypothetical protein n=1 Tax=Streptomyces sp. NPDC085463 TaxID=3365724 RepID=UPI0037D6658F